MSEHWGECIICGMCSTQGHEWWCPRNLEAAQPASTGALEGTKEGKNIHAPKATSLKRVSKGDSLGAVSYQERDTGFKKAETLLAGNTDESQMTNRFREDQVKQCYLESASRFFPHQKEFVTDLTERLNSTRTQKKRAASPSTRAEGITLNMTLQTAGDIGLFEFLKSKGYEKALGTAPAAAGEEQQ